MFLTPEELIELTGYQKPALQKRMGISAEAHKRRQGPNLGAIL